jgi:hypothetical protein
MEPWGHTNLDKNKLYGCITVANIGRRPIFISHAAIKLPAKHEYGLILSGINGDKLSEGDPPVRYLVQQEGLEKHSKNWDKIKACVTDSAGKSFYSKSVLKRPSWANVQKDL